MKNAELRNEQVWLVVGSLMILATVVLAAALVYMRDVMIPFVLAIFITAVVAPIADFQVIRWRLPSWIALLMTLLLVLAMLGLVGVVLIIAVQTMVHLAGDYSQQVVEIAERLLAALNSRGIQVDQTHITAELVAHLPGSSRKPLGRLRRSYRMVF
jgi:predicted PurR-regulated permease PerM